MDNKRINRIMAEQTAEQTGLKPSQVQRIIRQYFESVKSIVDGIDFGNMTEQEYAKMKKRGVYVPGLGKFLMNWRIIDAWQKSKNGNKRKIKEDDKD